jgi:hypothetical protein
MKTKKGKIMRGFVLSAVLLNLFGCSGCKTEGDNIQSVVSDGMELVIEQGEHWLGKMKVFIFSMKHNPQLAAWIEDSNGNYINTIVVSEKSAKGNWKSAPREGRPEALPVWDHKHQNISATDNLDVVSSATIKGSFEASINKRALVDGNTYNVYFEINHSFDYNDYWTKDNSGVNGQPSLVYHAQFIAGQSGNIPLVLIGHGSVDGSNGNITNGLENFTSALSIVKNVYIVVK